MRPEYGQRVPKEIHQQFSTLLQSSRAAPTMSHYLRYDHCLLRVEDIGANIPQFLGSMEVRRLPIII